MLDEDTTLGGARFGIGYLDFASWRIRLKMHNYVLAFGCTRKDAMLVSKRFASIRF